MSYYINQQTAEGHLGQVTRLDNQTQIVVQNTGIAQGTFELQVFFLSLDLVNVVQSTSSGPFSLNAGEVKTQLIFDPSLAPGSYTERILLNNLTFAVPKTDDSKEFNITVSGPSPTPTPSPQPVIPQWVAIVAGIGIAAIVVYALTRKKKKKK